ncbi:site-specific integrase [Nostoc sp. FACHB-190]|uniref:tyrosine-type recombinase/integrase n=1 Tax=Nostoc sp. FACHB-190 TaxID=2692838 RepID=UPI001686DF89|nr:site-specific integrase [Nostoc sp. FACHB-190]MBD2303224.1 site-specific integrase [Nostoc sp. FACHB-190]
MKIDRHGRAKILTQEEIQLLFSPEVTTARDRALYAVMLFTACRVNEAVTLRKRDVYDAKGRVRREILFRKGNTKRKLATRSVPVIEDLRYWLQDYHPREDNEWLFPGNEYGPRIDDHLHKDSAMWILRQACKRIGIEGVSSHSFRRTALTQMSNAGIPLRVIQEISGHRTLDELYKYLEVKDEQVLGAVSSLSMLSPTKADHFGKSSLNEVTTTPDTEGVF